MSDAIKHECGLAFIRLRKPFSYYQQKYGSVLWGLNKMYLLMEKQHNRGQDGAGLATVKLNVEPGYPFLSRIRSNEPQPIADIFKQVGQEFTELQKFNPDFGKQDRKSTRLNSSHMSISYAVFCLKKKKKITKSLLIIK